MVRAAFTLIEMVFAIVLIGIIVAGVPQMIARNTQTSANNLSQEALFLASAAAVKVLTYRWDENSKDTNVTASSYIDYSKVLDLTNAAPERQTVPVGASTVTLPLRVGHIPQDKHRRFHSVITEPAEITLQGASITLTDDTVGAEAFKRGYTLDIQGGYAATPFGTTWQNAPATNTKMAEVKIDETATGDNIVTLRIYAFNIGEIDYAKRTF